MVFIICLFVKYLEECLAYHENLVLFYSLSQISDSQQLCIMGELKGKQSLPINRPYVSNKKNFFFSRADVWYRWGKKMNMKVWSMACPCCEAERNKVREAESSMSPAHWLGLAKFSGKAGRKEIRYKKKGNLISCCYRSGTQCDFTVVPKHLPKNCPALS